jgi:hypothetical protein
MQTHPSILATLSLAFAATACTSTDTSARLAGALDVTTTTPPTSGSVMMFWTRSDASDTFAVGQYTVALSQFPGQYVLDLTAAPPGAALNDYGDGGGRAAFGLVLLANPSLPTDFNTVTLEQFQASVYGGAEYDVVAYLPEGAQPGSQAATRAAGSTTVGYHLLHVDANTGGWPTMHEVDVSTPVDLLITDINDLDLPDLKGASSQGGGSNSGAT